MPHPYTRRSPAAESSSPRSCPAERKNIASHDSHDGLLIPLSNPRSPSIAASQTPCIAILRALVDQRVEGRTHSPVHLRTQRHAVSTRAHISGTPPCPLTPQQLSSVLKGMRKVEDCGHLSQNPARKEWRNRQGCPLCNPCWDCWELLARIHHTKPRDLDHGIIWTVASMRKAAQDGRLLICQLPHLCLIFASLHSHGALQHIAQHLRPSKEYEYDQETVPAVPTAARN